MTTTGPVRVADLEPGVRVYALNPTVGLLKPKLLTDIDMISHGSELVELSGRRVDLRLHPTHPVLYRTKARPTPRFVQAGGLKHQEYYRFINEWRPPSGTCLDAIDITDHLKRFQARATTAAHGHTFRAALPDGCNPSYVNSHSGYHFDAPTFKRYQSVIESIADEVSVREGRNQRTHPYRFDGDDFIELVGWFVTEGSVYWPTGKRTAQVNIAQEMPQHRRQLRGLFDRMGLAVGETAERFVFSSTLFGSLLESMCGRDSRTKRLPRFVWRLPVSQKQLLMNTLLAGDGNERGTYYTVSQRLAHDVLRLALELGYKPRYSQRKPDRWRVQLSQGSDGFRASRNVATMATRVPVYRLVVEDYCAIMAGRNGRFQWVGACGVV
jgi:DNA polymerase I